MFKKAKKFLSVFDFFGYNNFFYLAEHKKYKTPFLGLICLIIIATFIVMSILKIINLFLGNNNTGPIISYFKINDSKNKMKTNKFPLMFQIQAEDSLYGETLDITKALKKSIFINNRKIDFNNAIVKCKDYDTSIHEEKLRNYIDFFVLSDKYIAENYFCFLFSNDYKTKIDDGEFSNFSYEEGIKIGLNYCIYDDFCYDPATMNNLIITLKLITIQYDTNLRKKDLLNFKLNQNIFTIKNKSSIDIELNKVVINSFEDPIPLGSNTSTNYEIYDSKIKLRERNKQEKLKDFNRNIIHDLEFNFLLSETIEYYTRTYENLFNILSTFGGIFSFIKFGTILVHFFYEFYYCNALFNFLFYKKEKNFDKFSNIYLLNSLKFDGDDFKAKKSQKNSLNHIINQEKNTESSNDHSHNDGTQHQNRELFNKYNNDFADFRREKTKTPNGNSCSQEFLLSQSQGVSNYNNREVDVDANNSLNTLEHTTPLNKCKKMTNINNILSIEKKQVKFNYVEKRGFFKIFTFCLKSGKEIRNEKYFIRKLFDMRNIMLLVLTKFNLYKYYKNIDSSSSLILFNKKINPIIDCNENINADAPNIQK